MSDKPNLVSILDQTQNHLILKWNAWKGRQWIKELGLATIYSLIAVSFLTAFSIESFFHNQKLYSGILFLFVVLTICIYIFSRLTGRKNISNSFLIMLLGILCLFLLYTGGIEGTGPLWIYVFPLFALFVLRLWEGVAYVIVLFICSVLILWSPEVSVKHEHFTQAFKERYIAVYLAISVMAFFYAFLRASTELELFYSNKRLQGLADTDELTKLPNRRQISSILYQEISRFRRTGSVFCVLMLDLDHFKRINDEYGHDCGDLVLKNTSMTISKALRVQDVAARWGGEEFLIVLPDTKMNDGKNVAERLRVAIGDFQNMCNYNSFIVTASMGLYEFQKNDTLSECLKKVDNKLYEAKAAGRNCIAT